MTTLVPVPTFGPDGFIAPAETEIKAGVMGDLQAAFGGDLNENDETPQGQLATSHAAIIGNCNSLYLQYTNLVDPARSFGRMQDAIGRIYFLTRIAAQPTLVRSTCVGQAGVIIDAGKRAQDSAGNIYLAIESAEINSDGQASILFANMVPGPTPCLAGALTTIIDAVPGWDSISNSADGVLGNDVETPAAFEDRRARSVAINALGVLPAIQGAVLAVPGVLDAYVCENSNGGTANIGGVILAPHSLYVATVGGADADVAQAIWSRKMPGCAYNGNTTVVVEDRSEGYSWPYPSYSVMFQRPSDLLVFMKIVLARNSLIPADAQAQIQNAIIKAFAGLDGGPRAKIGAKLRALRFYSAISSLGSWAQVVSILIGSANAPAAEFGASIAGPEMTVTIVTGGVIAVGQIVGNSNNSILSGTQIIAQISGTAGGAGVYQVSKSQSVALRPSYSVTPSLFDIDVRIDQSPSSSADLISVVIE